MYECLDLSLDFSILLSFPWWNLIIIESAEESISINSIFFGTKH